MSDAPTRTASTIQFPYTDIEDAISVARGLMQGGGMPLSRDQLAAAMNAAPGSGSFNVKLGTARAFQVMETKDGKYQLTELGFEIVDGNRQKEAMIRAFLSVELYKKTYDEFRNKLLPPRPHGLEAAFVNFGVSPKQKERARTAFDKSARAAGFFPNGNEDRLVLPVINGALNVTLEDVQASEGTANVSEGEGGTSRTDNKPAVAGLHGSIIGMLEELPPPKSSWNRQEQADWLQAMATMFKVIYKSDDGGAVMVSVTKSQSPA